MILNFGKHKGMDVEDVPSSYLKWLLTETNRMDAAVVKAAEEELRYRDKWDVHFED